MEKRVVSATTMCQDCRHDQGPEGFALRDDGSTVDLCSDLEAFTQRFSVPAHSEPRGLSGEMAEFRLARLREELDEYEEALREEDLEKQLDALVDLVYIAVGNAYISGFRFAEAHARVHAANMLKIRARRESESRHGSLYDIVKPEGWQPASLSDLVAGASR